MHWIGLQNGEDGFEFWEVVGVGLFLWSVCGFEFVGLGNGPSQGTELRGLDLHVCVQSNSCKCLTWLGDGVIRSDLGGFLCGVCACVCVSGVDGLCEQMNWIGFGFMG